MSATPNWTPGKWRWNMDEDGVGTLYGGEISEPLAIADFWRKSLRHEPQDTRFNSDLKAEQIANLNVAAAATSLYDALAKCQATLALLTDSANKDASIVHAWAQCVEAETAARAALSLATEGPA